MLNIATIQGRLTADPILKDATNGPQVIFTIATQRRKGADGDYITDFIPCTAWRKQAEFIQRWFRKGSMIIATGRIQSRQIEDDLLGVKRTYHELYITDVNFCESQGKSVDE